MTKITSLHSGVEYTHGEPEESVVKCLEDWLERARSGELVGIVAGTYHSDASTSWRLRGRYRKASMIGVLEGAKATIVRDMIDE